MSTARPDVSVVITCYNYARYVAEAARSALDQEGVELEVIVVDDVSTDDSLEVIRAIAAQDPRVRVVARAENGGAARAFNDGLSRVRGRAWVRLDADDVLTPGSLRRGLDVLDAEPRVGLVYGKALFAQDGEPWPEPDLRVTTWSVWRGRDWLDGLLRNGLSVIVSVEAMARTAATDEVGPMVPLRNAQDYELWLRIAHRWEVARIDGVHQGVHRTHGGSLSERRWTDLMLKFRQSRDVYEAYLGSGVVDASEVPRLRERIRRVAALEALDTAMHLWDRGRSDAGELAAGIRLACELDPGVRGTARYRAAAQRLAARREHPLWRLTSLGAAAWRRARHEAGLRLHERTGAHSLWAALHRDTYRAPTA